MLRYVFCFHQMQSHKSFIIFEFCFYFIGSQLISHLFFSFDETKKKKNKKQGLYLGETIPELFSMPTSLEFARDFVAKNLPVVIREATAHWPACTKWNSKYFRYEQNTKKKISTT